MKLTDADIMEADFQMAYGIVHNALVNVEVAKRRGEDVLPRERGAMLLRTALYEYEKVVREEMGLD